MISITDNLKHSYVLEEIKRLEGDKQDLIDTGVYNEEDELIKELNKRIQNLKN